MKEIVKEPKKEQKKRQENPRNPPRISRNDKKRALLRFRIILMLYSDAEAMRVKQQVSIIEMMEDSCR